MLAKHATKYQTPQNIANSQIVIANSSHKENVNFYCWRQSRHNDVSLGHIGILVENFNYF